MIGDDVQEQCHDLDPGSSTCSSKYAEDMDVSDITFDSGYDDEDSVSSANGSEMSLFLEHLDQLTRLGPSRFIENLRLSSSDPRVLFDIFTAKLPCGAQLLDDESLWRLLERMLIRHYYVRQPLAEFVLVSDFVRVLGEAKSIVVVIGAGVSVSSGVPDFRSPGTGLYSRISERFPEIGSPEDIFDLEMFRTNAAPFYTIARELIANDIQPSPSHYFIKYLEDTGRLLRVYSQNIDTLECAAGLRRVCFCHGSFQSATCLSCGQKLTQQQLKELMATQDVPSCYDCSGTIKPDIVFFGESLPKYFDKCIADDVQKADCFIVMGSSMKVHPVSAIPDIIPPHVPQFYINKTPSLDHNYDLQLLGDADLIVGLLRRAVDGDPSILEAYPATGNRWAVFPGAVLPQTMCDGYPSED